MRETQILCTVNSKPTFLECHGELRHLLNPDILTVINRGLRIKANTVQYLNRYRIYIYIVVSFSLHCMFSFFRNDRQETKENRDLPTVMKIQDTHVYIYVYTYTYSNIDIHINRYIYIHDEKIPKFSGMSCSSAIV